MGETRKPDFSGWATKNNLECSDGRTILPGAFKHQDKTRVPLVWQHDHNDPSNVLGHANLYDRAFGIFTEGFFNNSQRAQDAKESVRHGDINALSIHANKLRQRGGGVLHGNIVEVSLVMSGANPGALITDINLSHSADGTEYSDEAIIYTGLTLEHSDNEEASTQGDTVAEETENQDNGSTDDKTVKEIFDAMSEEQKNVVYYMIGAALEDGQDDDPDEDDVDGGEATHYFEADEILEHIDKSIQEGINEMARNTFATHGAAEGSNTARLSHSQFAEIVQNAKNAKAESFMDELRHSGGDILSHADGDVAGVDYGVANIELLFPDARALETTPEFISRRMGWVDDVLKSTKHTPFANVKTLHADITEPEARAKGYIKGNRKKEEVFKLLKRTTGPTTIYKKQALDRDDILDITDFNVVIWLQQEMRLMLEEEIARSILVGDGRSELSDDKISDPAGAVQGKGIRSILHDDELYATHIELPANTAPKDMVKGFIRGRTHLKGSGKPTLYISDDALTDMMLEEDKIGRALYETEQALADKLRVAKIVPIELFGEYDGLIAIAVNLIDYNIGTNKGGEITNMDDFDINFNKHYYLSETRLSGGLVKAKSALVFTRATGTSVTPEAPTLSGNTITIPTTTGVLYFINDELATGTVEITEDTEVVATADEGYYIPSGATRSWSFTYTAG